MDTTSTKEVAHGLTYSKIRNISVMIRPDTGAGELFIPLDWNNGSQAGWFFIAEAGDTGNIGMVRQTGGVFDNASYNSTSFNRGYIFIDYEA